ncbi:Right handed beta helix region [anaerobic digester metagenome]
MISLKDSFKKLNIRICVIFIVGILISFSLGVFAIDDGTNSNTPTIIESGSGNEEADYTIFCDDEYTYIKNGTTNEITYKNARANLAIQKAITDLPATGGKIYIKSGTYIIDTAIQLKSNVTIQGSGSSTILKTKDLTSITVIVALTYIRNITITDITIDGNNDSQVESGQSTNQGGIYCYAITSTFKNINFINMYHYGIYLQETPSAEHFGNTIDNCLFKNFEYKKGKGIYLAYKAEYNRIINCQFTGIDYAIYSLSANNIISGCSIQNYYSAGIYFSGSNNWGHSQIIGNEINHGTIKGIWLNGVSDMIISNNQIFYAQYGIYISGNSNRNQISNNYLALNHNAIYFYGFGISNSITDNVMYQNGNATQVQFYIYENGGNYNYTTIIGNNIDGNLITGVGLWIADDVDNTIVALNTFINHTVESYRNNGTNTVNVNNTVVG